MLKRKSIVSRLILTMILLLGSSMTTYAKERKEMSGCFDEIENGAITGWGWNSTSPDEAVSVHVKVTSKATAKVVGDFQTTALEYRQDLEEDGIGNGKHGFYIEMNWDSMEDGDYFIEGWTGSEKFDNTVTYTNKTSNENQSAENENGASSLKSLGVFRTTGYCPCYQCSEGWGRHTSTGAIAKSNHTIAVDPRIIPYGSKVMVNGVVYTAEDRGGGVKGNHIDIFYDTHAQTRQHGNLQQEVFLVS